MIINNLQCFELGIAVGAAVMTLVFYILSLDTKRGDESIAEWQKERTEKGVPVLKCSQAWFDD